MPSCPGPTSSFFPRSALQSLRKGPERPARAPQAGGLTNHFTCFLFSSVCVQRLCKKKKKTVHYLSNPVRTENNKVVLLFGFVCELFSSVKTGQASPASLQGTWTHGREA